MKKPLILLVITFIAFSTFGQSAKKEIPVFSTYHKNIYVELLGSSIGAGLHFDMRLNKGRMDGIGFRAGIGGINIAASDENNVAKVGLITFPIEFNHLIGKRRSSFITGVGLLPAYASASIQGDRNAKGKGFGLAGGFLDIGYRFQPKKTGFMFQINWNPLINSSGLSAGWFGIGLGMGFK